MEIWLPEESMWESEDEAWSEDESVSSSVSRENNVCNGALHVIGLYGPGDKVSLSLEDWELARVALSCNIARMRPGSWVDAAREASVSQQDKPFSHRGRGVTIQE